MATNVMTSSQSAMFLLTMTSLVALVTWPTLVAPVAPTQRQQLPTSGAKAPSLSTSGSATSSGSASSLPSPSWSTVEEFCDWETINASCPEPDQVLIIRQARYGRLRLGRCVAKNYGHLGCGTDVTSLLERMCSARRSCQLSVISLHGTPTTCPSDLKAYVQLTYDCVTGLTQFTF